MWQIQLIACFSTSVKWPVSHSWRLVTTLLKSSFVKSVILHSQFLFRFVCVSGWFWWIVQNKMCMKRPEKVKLAMYVPWRHIYQCLTWERASSELTSQLHTASEDQLQNCDVSTESAMWLCGWLCHTGSWDNYAKFSSGMLQKIGSDSIWCFFL
jgi:hypothetical protein